MPKVDLKLSSTATNGKKQTTTIAYANPSASNTVLKSFAQQLNNLTTNNYESSDRIETVNLDTEQGKTPRDIDIVGLAQGATATVTANSAGNQDQPIAIFKNGGTVILSPSAVSYPSATTIQCQYSIPSRSGTLYIGMPETAQYLEAFIARTVS